MADEFVTHDSRLTDENLHAALNKKEAEAKRILEDKDATEETLSKAQKLLKKIRKLPVIGNLVDDIATMIELVKDYVNGTYTKVPFRVILSVMGALLYLISPIDLIPDGIPVIGFVDDAAVIMMVLKTGVSSELNLYRLFKKEQALQALWTPVASRITTAKGSQFLLAVLLTTDNTLKLLLTSNPAHVMPPHVITPVTVDFPYQEFQTLSRETKNPIPTILQSCIEKRADLYNDLTIDICYESDFAEYDTYFTEETED